MISAIICTYNRERFLKELFASIELQTLDPGRFEVVIVDNNSTDGTKNISNQFAQDNPLITARYFFEPNQGLSFARNRGVAESNGSWLTFLDDDATLTPNFLETVLDYFEKNPDLYCIGGKILLNYETLPPPPWVSKYIVGMFGYFNPGNKGFVFTNGTFPRGSNMSFAKSVFAKLGGFNTHLGRAGSSMVGSEEKEFFARFLKKGLKAIYLPQAVVYHSVSDERIKISSVLNHARGIGLSEKIMAKANGFSGWAFLWLGEAFKWLASFGLFGYYGITLRFNKGWFLLRFRFNVTKGMLGRS